MEEISGIYRIYIETNYLLKTKEEYSYIGVSKNIKQRLKIHIRNINMFLNDEKQIYGTYEFNFSYWLHCSKIPTKEESSFKIAIFLLINNLTINDLNIEILEKCSLDKKEEIEDKKIYYIEKYDSEWKGFNGVFTKTFEYIKLLNNVNLQDKNIRKNNKEMIKKLESENQRQLNKIEYSIKNNILPMPWIFENYKKTPYYLKEREDIKKYFKDGRTNWLVSCKLALEIMNKKNRFINDWK